MDFLIQFFTYLFPDFYQVNEGDVIGLFLLILLIALIFIFYFSLKKSDLSRGTVAREEKGEENEILEETLREEVKEVKTEVPTSPPPVAEKSWSERLSKGLSRSREQIFLKMGQLLSGKKIGKEELEVIEELLYSADLGPKIVQDLISQLELSLPKKEMGIEELKEFLYDYMHKKLSPIQEKLPAELFAEQPLKNEGRPCSMMIVGVNGAGKTTTIGKLATQFAKNGNKVFVGACDTFRAAAVDQLQIWCDRASVPMVRAREGADPSGVAFETLQKSIAEKADYCLLDTAGRLHTKSNLMEELKKSKKVLSKLDEKAPHHTFLVLDAVTGQNAIKQAQEFHKTLGITALVFTKCDGSAKAGSAVGIMDELQVPIAYIGVGEGVLDLRPFNLNEYLEVLLDYKPKN